MANKKEELLNQFCENYNTISKDEQRFLNFLQKYYKDYITTGEYGYVCENEDERVFFDHMKASKIGKIPLVKNPIEKKWCDFFEKIDKNDLILFCTKYVYSETIDFSPIISGWEVLLNKYFPVDKNLIISYINFLYSFGWDASSEVVKRMLENNDIEAIANLSKKIHYYPDVFPKDSVQLYQKV